MIAIHTSVCSRRETSVGSLTRRRARVPRDTHSWRGRVEERPVGVMNVLLTYGAESPGHRGIFPLRRRAEYGSARFRSIPTGISVDPLAARSGTERASTLLMYYRTCPTRSEF